MRSAATTLLGLWLLAAGLAAPLGASAPRVVLVEDISNQW